MASVYVSSTYEDLIECRDAVYRTLRQLGHDVVAMEDYVARDERPRAKCEADVRAADLYVGIVALRYGFVPSEDNVEQRSITELEYRAAGHAGVPRLVFLLADDASWPVNRLDRGEAEERILQFRKLVSTECIVSYFDNCDQLGKAIAVAVPQALAEAAGRGQTANIDPSVLWSALVGVVRRPSNEWRSAFDTWWSQYGRVVVEEYAVRGVGSVSRSVAGRWRRRIERRRERERERQLQRTIQDAVRDALSGAPDAPGG
jgi:Domain of unknown function (DUF4062)